MAAVVITAYNVTMAVDRMMALLIGSEGFTTRAYIHFWNAIGCRVAESCAKQRHQERNAYYGMIAAVWMGRDHI
jgi:hypothetical protein